MHLFYISYVSECSLRWEARPIVLPCALYKVVFTGENDGNKYRALIKMIEEFPVGQNLENYDKSVWLPFF
jgi:hypothetical protein